MTTELMTIDSVVALKGKKAIEVLSSPAKLQPLIDHVRAEALSVQYDVTTSKGRKEVGTAANNVVQSRKPIVDAIDKHISELNNTVSGLKEAKSYVENEFKLIKGEVLKPRTEWQAEQDRIEQDRIDGIRERINNLRNIGNLTGNEDRAHIETLIESLEAQDLSTGFDELTQEAMQVRQEMISNLNARIMQIIEEESQAKQRVELEISSMKSVVADAMDWSKSQIENAIDELKLKSIDDSFGDRMEEALTVREKSVTKLAKLAAMADDDEEPETLPFTDHMISEEDEPFFNDCVADAQPVEEEDQPEDRDYLLAENMCKYMDGMMSLDQAYEIISMVREFK